MSTLYFDKEQRPIDEAQWKQLFADMEYRFVAIDELPGDCRVMTIWEGVAKGAVDGEPCIFESMVFAGPLNHTSQRYATLADARVGHRQLVMRVITALLEEAPP